MRVVHLINGLGRGGGERMLVDLIETVPGIDRYAVYCLTREGELAEELRSRGVPVRLLRWHGLPLPWRLYTLWQDLARADVLHTHFFWSDLVGAWLGRLAGVGRLVSTRHETGYWMREAHRILERRFVNRFDVILCVSQAVRESLEARGVRAERLRLAPPGMVQRPDVAPEEPPPPREPVILSVGRLEPVKGHDVLLRAFASSIREPGTEAWRLVLVGGGSRRPALESLARTLGIEDRCELAGALPPREVAARLRRASCFVLPSRAEALPLSLLEAMDHGAPVVATAVGGVGEVVRHGETGWLVPPDDPVALAAAIVEVMRDPRHAAEVAAAAGHDVAARFGAQSFAARIRDAYGESGPPKTERSSHDVCMLVRNRFRADSRVEREASFLARRGLRVLVLAQGDGELPSHERRGGFDIERLSLSPRALGGRDSRPASARARLADWILDLPAVGRPLARARTLRSSARYYARAMKRVMEALPSRVHCHDLDTLLPGTMAARMIGSRAIYDSHELWTERNHGLRGHRRRLDYLRYTAMERILVRHTESVITVSDSIAEELVRRYGIDRPTVLRNVPDLEAAQEAMPSLQKRVGEGGPILLHLGVVDMNRGIEPLVRALARLERARLVLLGPARPYALEPVRDLAGALGVADRVLHLEPVPPSEVMSLAKGADVGLCLFEPVCLSHVFALPNKLFEYAFAGLPVVASDFPEMGRWVREYHLGALCDPSDPGDIARAVGEVLSGEAPRPSPEERERLRAAYGWSAEAAKLARLYGLDGAG